MKSLTNIQIYTDGSSKDCGGMRYGGWCFIVVENGFQKYYQSGNDYKVTNQQMELTAAIKACEYIAQRRDNQDVEIMSDSAYLVNCYQQNWYKNWKRNGWVNSKGEDVANQDLWWQLIPFFENPHYSFRKVKGHSNNIFNNKCDEIAQHEADLARLNRGIAYDKQE